MKKFVALIFLFFLIISACRDSGSNPQKELNNSKIEFESNEFNFGKIAFKSDGTCVFGFTNTSKNPLVINVVKTSCGCTNPEWPKNPVEPGNTGEIKVKYNTEIPGSFQKSITVYSNAVNSPVKLIIKGEVLPDPSVASSSSNQ